MAEKPEYSIGQLRWRCRRGTKELDRILGGYLESEFSSSSPELQAAFVKLLEVQDPDVFDWLMGAAEPEAQYQALVGNIRVFAKL